MTRNAPLVLALMASGAFAQEAVSPPALAIAWEQATLQPLQLQGRTALDATRALVGQGLRCRTEVTTWPLPFLAERVPTPAPEVFCERKLREDLGGYPRLWVRLETTWGAGDKRRLSELFAALDTAMVRSAAVTGLNPYRAVTDPAAAQRAEQDLQSAYGPMQAPATAAEMVARLVDAKLSCGLAGPAADGVPGIACTQTWPTPTCRIAQVDLEVTGPELPVAQNPDVLWSVAHTVRSWKWRCLDITDNRARDERDFIYGAPR